MRQYYLLFLLGFVNYGRGKLTIFVDLNLSKGIYEASVKHSIIM